MLLIKYIFKKYLSLRGSVSRRYFRNQALLLAFLNGSSLVWPKSSRASVPLRIDGPGRVSLEESISLGYRPAPRIGSGEILLQAREKHSVIFIGKGTSISNNLSIVCRESVIIGKNCLIGDMVTIIDSDFHELDPSSRHKSAGKTAAVVIGDNVWLGSKVSILKGVHIGNNTVIAAGSIVTKSIASNVVAAGLPAKVVKHL